jgi:hypothetical protein
MTTRSYLHSWRRQSCPGRPESTAHESRLQGKWLVKVKVSGGNRASAFSRLNYQYLSLHRQYIPVRGTRVSCFGRIEAALFLRAKLLAPSYGRWIGSYELPTTPFLATATSAAKLLAHHPHRLAKPGNGTPVSRSRIDGKGEKLGEPISKRLAKPADRVTIKHDVGFALWKSLPQAEQRSRGIPENGHWFP